MVSSPPSPTHTHTHTTWRERERENHSQNIFNQVYRSTAPRKKSPKDSFVMKLNDL